MVVWHIMNGGKSTMIKLEHVVLPSPEQMGFVIEGMRNPMNSWDKSDSGLVCAMDPTSICSPTCTADNYCKPFHSHMVGPNDFSLMQKLSAAGTDHRKFMRMMPVMVRITAPLYWWKEFDTYKVGTVANSCSTMHKITEKEFDISDFSTEHLTIPSETILEDTINVLNEYRAYYLDWNNLTEDTRIANDWNDKKDIWWQLIQLLPSSYNQTRNVMLNYEVLANIYHSRKNHKLDEWVEFCEWIETLPYSELITDSHKNSFLE